jgi:glucose-6-phosphate isomerase
MPKPLVSYDATNMMAKAVGRSGARPQELRKLSKKLNAAKKAVLKLSKTKSQGWLALPDDEAMVKRIKAMAAKKRRFTTCLVIGIGGSDLGARALYHALDGNGMDLVFAGANTDPDELACLMSCMDWKRTLVNVISKSGDTVEPMATFLIVRDALIHAVGKARHAEHVVATTDAKSGSLRAMAKREGYDTLVVPNNVGGRFSVLSDVGLFPLACSGVNISKILDGARRERDAFMKERPNVNSPTIFAALNFLASVKRGQHIDVLMPYAESLRQFGFWYRQIWAESLGKRKDRKERMKNVGLTPIAALGATDQHSQIQLYNEGPNDKTVTFIHVGSFSSGLRIPVSVKDIPKLSYLSGMKLERVIHAEEQGTAEALRKSHRPNGTLVIPTVSPESMGSLIMFFEIATAMSGELFNINAYDQPGVESGKRAMKRFLLSR